MLGKKNPQKTTTVSLGNKNIILHCATESNLKQAVARQGQTGHHHPLVVAGRAPRCSLTIAQHDVLAMVAVETKP